MYKITSGGKTMVGCNHDAWLTTPMIWFENAKGSKEHGVAFTGARRVSKGRTTPQSGMNTAGLSFSRLTSYYPEQENPFQNKLKIKDEASYLSEILHKCANISEVANFIEGYDHSFFLNDVFIYIDSLGDYLIVEPYQLIRGSQSTYVLANFCPSITTHEEARNLERYRNGNDFLALHPLESSLDFSRRLSDTMHVCRKRNGDGTLISSIWDSKEGRVNLYFYHDYDTTIQFNIADELAKGDHGLAIPALFPENPEFNRLTSYKTPANTIEIRITLAVIVALLMLFSLFSAISIFRKKSSFLDRFSSFLITAVNLVLILYTAVLISHQSIFYFDAPYEHYSSKLISVSSYTPFLLLLLFIPLFVYERRKLRSNQIRIWKKGILIANHFIYLILLLGFAYWGLFSFWK